MDGLYSSNPNKYFVTVLIAIILVEFLIITSQSVSHFMLGYLNPEETSFMQTEQTDFTTTIDKLEKQIEELEQKNMNLEVQISSLNNKIILLSTDNSPTPVPR